MTTSSVHRSIFAQHPAIVGMVHVGALPGTPRAEVGLLALIDTAVGEATRLADAGVDGVLIENMHDVPYLRREVGPEIVAAMTAVGCAVQRAVSVPIGVQVLAGANRAALAVALSCGARFIRAEGFAFAHVADEGLMEEADAGPLLRYRRAVGADTIAIWADVKKKHSSHAITADVDLAATASAAAFFGADAIVITGASTGAPTSIEDLEQARAAVGIPLVVGSGTTPDNLAALWPRADVFIVGSTLKREGRWSEPLDPDRLEAFMARVGELRSENTAAG